MSDAASACDCADDESAQRCSGRGWCVSAPAALPPLPTPPLPPKPPDAAPKLPSAPLLRSRKATPAAAAAAVAAAAAAAAAQPAAPGPRGRLGARAYLAAALRHGVGQHAVGRHGADERAHAEALHDFDQLAAAAVRAGPGADCRIARPTTYRASLRPSPPRPAPPPPRLTPTARDAPIRAALQERDRDLFRWLHVNGRCRRPRLRLLQPEPLARAVLLRRNVPKRAAALH